MTDTRDLGSSSAASVFAVHRMRVGDGEMLTLSGSGSVLAVVGANNVGKSTLIDQIWLRLANPMESLDSLPQVLTEVDTALRCTSEDIETWLRNHSEITEYGGITTVRRGVISEQLETAVRQIFDSPPLLRLTSWFVSRIALGDRLTSVQMTNLPGEADVAAHPFHTLYYDKPLRDKVIALARKLFGIDLYFAVVGNQLSFRIGDPGVEVPPANEMNRAYAQAVGALRSLQDQGGGVCAALGLIMQMITSPSPVTIIDEPEAYLHPPQARLLGKEIGLIAGRNASQIVVATHDKDILRGVIDSGTPVDILHLTRVADVTSGRLLSSEDVAELWKDPSLRYGNALEGLFHSAVILTEADRDSRFYEAAIDAYSEARLFDSSAHNLMFLGANGKQNLSKLVVRLRDFGMRVVSCPDLDILNNEAVLRPLVEAHGGLWADIESDYRKAANQFKNAPPPPNAKIALRNIIALLESADGPVTQELAAKIKAEVVLPKTTWQNLKHYGMRAFREELASANNLIEYLERFGIVVVKVGELERFLTTVTVGKSDPAWLSIAFAQGAHTSVDAVDHAVRLLKAAGIEPSAVGESAG